MSSKPSNFGKVLLTQSRVNKRARKRGGSGVGGIAPNGSNDGEANSSSSGRARRRINQTMHMKENVPSLHEFMHRQTVISQYRQFFRAINTVGDKDSSTSMKNEVRTAFKSLLHEEDKFSIKIALKEGERRLKELKSMVGYVDRSEKTQADDADSWLNIDDEEDPRGRVGVQWPWDDKK